jgi:dipeptidyl-peptidase-4
LSRPFERISIEQVARYPRPGANVPGHLGFTPDGSAVTFLFSEAGTLVRELWAQNIRTRARRKLVEPPPGAEDEEGLSLEEQMRRERARMRELGITSYQFARDADPPVLLVPLGQRLFVSRGAEALREVQGTEGAIEPRLSRDGSRAAFVRDGELWVVALAGGEPRQLTFGAEPGLTNGLAEFIAQEELDRDEGFWWSRDRTRIAFEQADVRHIPIYPIVHQGRETVDIEEHRYPFAGQANAKVRLGVVEVDSGAISWLELGNDEDIYLARVAWRADGTLAALVLSRDQRHMRWLAFDPATGKRSTLLEERGEPWLNLDHDTRFLESGEVLLSSERTGYRHLYLHADDGSLVRQLTSGDWVVTRLITVDEERRIAYFQGTREGVLERHVYSVSLDGGDVQPLTHSAGWHDAVFSKDCSLYLDVHGSLDRAPAVMLRSTDGTVETPVFANEGNDAETLGLRPPALLRIPVAEGVELDAALYEPPALEPGRKYPLIVSVYGGPHAQSVANQWGLTVDMRAQYLAQEGFCVLKVDNRGSANRGLDFEAPIHLRLGTVEVADQAAAVRWLAAHRPEIDLERVGIYGWSYGGYMACMAMMREPGLFKVGVAGAPVSDWDGYDTGYTERYMSTPQQNPGGYREGSVLTHAGRLEGKLLLVHGMVDENVHFRHTARLAVALAAAQKTYDMLVFPEERHMPRDAKGLEYQERRLIDYFRQHL